MLESLSAAAKKNNTDISVKRPGEEVDIKNQTGDSAICGNTSTQVFNQPGLQNHQGFAGRLQLRASLEADRTFKIELINNSFDFLDAGPLHARNEGNITLKADSPAFGTLVPCNPRSATLLYEGTVKAGGSPADVVPSAAFNIRFGIKLAASVTKSNLVFKMPFKAGVRVSCVEGRNTGTHLGAHQFAIDFGVPRGTEVVAAVNGGVVDLVSNQSDMPIGARGADANDNIVRIRHDDLTYGIYGHLIGIISRTGNSENLKLTNRRRDRRCGR